MTATFIHGFTQTGDSWRPVLDHGTFPSVECIDAPGHGRSAAAEGSLWTAADSIAAHMTPGPLVGYSMGGRIALHVALAHPSLVTRLALISATPGLEDPDERLVRRTNDGKLADRIVEIGVEAFVDEWMRGPLFATYSPTESDVCSRRTNTPEGLASSLRCHGTGSQDDLWPRVHELRMPVLLITGGLDTKFSEIALRMSRMIDDVRHVTVPQAGHAVHLERPAQVARLLEAFLAGGNAVSG